MDQNRPLKWGEPLTDWENEREESIGGPCESNRLKRGGIKNSISFQDIRDFARTLMLDRDAAFRDTESPYRIYRNYELWRPQEDGRVSLEGCGIELLGFYHSFHDNWMYPHPFPFPYGIYLYTTRISNLAIQMANHYSVPHQIMLGALLYMVLHHEFHHFVEELILSQFELVCERVIYKEWSQLYTRLWPQGTLNEALANAMALRKTKDFLSRRNLGAFFSLRGRIIQALEYMLNSSPGAYSEYKKFMPQYYDYGLTLWIEQATQGRYGERQRSAVELIRHITIDFMPFVPVHLISGI